MPDKRKTTKPREVDTDWFLEHMVRQDMNIKSLAQAVAWNEHSLGRIIRGRRRADLEAVLQLAREFGVSTEEILTRLGYGPDLPLPATSNVVGHVTGTALIERKVPPEVVMTPDQSLLALKCVTENTPLHKYHNSVLYYSLMTEQNPNAWLALSGRLAVLEISEPLRAVVGVYTAGNGSARIELWGDVGVIETPKLVAGSAIQWIKLDG